jgi:S-adenosylmethionine synthetase
METPVPYRSLFTSESITNGHPDKVADQISDAVLDAVMAEDPDGRVACETFVLPGRVLLGGEIRTAAQPDFEVVVREAIRRIGYTTPGLGFEADACDVEVAMVEQSPDIAAGVDTAFERRAGEADGEDPYDQLGAGDQGLMFGYACDDTPELMPLPIGLAHRLSHRLTEVRESGAMPYLHPDGKTQVTIGYEDGEPVALETVLVSAHHDGDVDLDRLRPDVEEHVIRPLLPEELDTSGLRILANPTGRFEKGGPAADAGLTGRKIIADTYGGMARHGGGAFSGKDCTKVDRSAAYAARWVAKNVVAAGLARKAEVQLAYAIGVARPVSVSLETFGTETVDPEVSMKAIDEVFDLRPAAIIDALELRRPVYRPTAAYGHFGRDGDGFTWERTDRAEQLREVVGVS